MNKWEDSFKKTSVMNDKSCHCADNQGLFIPNRQLSALVAALFLIFFAVFMTGYFLGKKKVVEQFTQEIRQDAFADQVYTTVITTNVHDGSSCLYDSLVTNSEEISTTLPSLNQDFTELSVENDIEQIAHERYYAQLIGFGTEKAAQLFVKKLAAKGIETEVKKRTSKTAKGNTSYWYQVVTAPFANKEELAALVNRLAKEENIKDACIRVC
jgi:hypothetical protein